MRARSVGAALAAALFVALPPGLAGDASGIGDPPVAAATEAPKPLSGRKVYQRVCMACHTLEVWGAPKLGDRSAWAARVAKGMEALYASALSGFNEMPARGTCQFCTDDELRAAVDYMVGKAVPRRRAHP